MRRRLGNLERKLEKRLDALKGMDARRAEKSPFDRKGFERSFAVVMAGLDAGQIAQFETLYAGGGAGSSPKGVQS